MPRARPADASWRALPPPTTALQRGAFIDGCVSWLVRETAPAVDEEEWVRTHVEHSAAPARGDTFIYTRSELCARTVGVCALCRAPSARVVLANPFSQRCYILECTDCARS